METVQMNTLVKGKTAKETIVISVVKMMIFIFDERVDGVVILGKVRQGIMTAAHRIFKEMIQIEFRGCHIIDCPSGIWSLLPWMLQDVCVP